MVKWLAMTEQKRNPGEGLRRPGLEIIFNCAWHNPPGSPGRIALEISLKPNQVISDGICGPCFAKQIALLDQLPLKPQK